MGVNLIVTKPNTCQTKKNGFLLFINSKLYFNWIIQLKYIFKLNSFIDRLVENDKIKRVVDNVYGLFQPKGGYSYFVYMGLSMMPNLLDVNVHPTKKQVIFDRQDDLCESLNELLQETLQAACIDKTFLV